MRSEDERSLSNQLFTRKCTFRLHNGIMGYTLSQDCQMMKARRYATTIPEAEEEDVKKATGKGFIGKFNQGQLVTEKQRTVFVSGVCTMHNSRNDCAAMR